MVVVSVTVEDLTTVFGLLDKSIKVPSIEMQAASEPNDAQPAFPNEIPDGPCRQRKVFGSLLKRQEATAITQRSGLAVRRRG